MQGENSVKGRHGFQKKYDDGEVLQKKIEEYFDTVPGEEWTRAGLALHLGVCKDTLLSYSRQDDDVGDVMKLALTRLEGGAELDLKRLTKAGRNPAGAIFTLKQYGWKNSQDVDVKGSGFEIVCTVPRPSEK